mmetsp:Transcript_80039/g.152168  ORF Transcript_80039/g.152168 Transcript_80039/m.152168 type:complete len:367 (+) Transcript_80039:132-1232(+)
MYEDLNSLPEKLEEMQKHVDSLQAWAVEKTNVVEDRPSHQMFHTRLYADDHSLLGKLEGMQQHVERWVGRPMYDDDDCLREKLQEMKKHVDDQLGQDTTKNNDKRSARSSGCQMHDVDNSLLESLEDMQKHVEGQLDRDTKEMEHGRKAKTSTAHPPQDAAFALFGNSGSGKSALANCIAEEAVFRAGLGCGIGVTTSASQSSIKRGHFEGTHIFDLPGLAQAKRRREAARACNKLLTQQGTLKLVVVIKPSQGRISEEDIASLSLILSVAPEIGTKYAVLVNQCGPHLMKCLGDAEWRMTFEKVLTDGLPHCTQHIYYQGRVSDLDEAEDAVCKLDDSLVKWLDDAPVAKILEKDQGIPEEDFMD